MSELPTAAEAELPQSLAVTSGLTEHDLVRLWLCFLSWPTEEELRQICQRIANNLDADKRHRLVRYFIASKRMLNVRRD